MKKTLRWAEKPRSIFIMSLLKFSSFNCQILLQLMIHSWDGPERAYDLWMRISFSANLKLLKHQIWVTVYVKIWRLKLMGLIGKSCLVEFLPFSDKFSQLVKLLNSAEINELMFHWKHCFSGFEGSLQLLIHTLFLSLMPFPNPHQSPLTNKSSIMVNFSFNYSL